MIKVVLDIILINISFVLAYLLRFKVLTFLAVETIPVIEEYSNVLIFVTLLWLVIFKFSGLYDQKKIITLIDELARLFVSVAFAALITFGLLFLYREFWVSRLVIVNAAWISLVFLGAMRSILFAGGRYLKAKGIGVKNVLILGAGEIGQILAKKFVDDKTLGYRAIGFLDDDPLLGEKIFDSIPVLGGLTKIKDSIRQYAVEEVIIANPKYGQEVILDIITECERYGVEFKLVPGILELIASRVDVDEVGGIPLLTVSEIKLKGINAIIKRLTDIVLSSILIIIFSPIFLLFTILVKITSPGQVLFLQDRAGLDENIFKMYKFRSMVNNAEELFPKLAPLSEVDGYLFKMKADPRITPLGKFMRRFSVDELPQLFNVFRGEMSLVGPRPPLPREVAKYSSWHKKRLRVRPGITGPWQVSGRSLLPFDDMVRLDIFYIENWSLWLDLKILLRTFSVVVFGSGAY